MNRTQILKKFLSGQFLTTNQIVNATNSNDRSKAASVQNVNKIKLLRKYLFGEPNY